MPFPLPDILKQRRPHVRGSREIGAALFVGGGGLFALFSVSAWFHVQSVRLSYRAQTVRQELERLERQEQAERRRLESALSLARLDQTARSRRGLALPRPDQVRLLPDV